MNLMTIFLSLFEPTGRLKALTAEQISELEAEFNFAKYLSRRRREEMAHMTKLGEELVEAWFEKRRRG